MPTIPSKSKRKKVDFLFLKTLPGIYLIIQLACCSLAFMLGVFNIYYKSAGHIFFLLVVSAACFTTTFWILVHFCEVKSSRLFKWMDWNKVGMIHSGVQGLLLMIGSSVMVDLACNARSLRAAGIFGFLGFTAFLIHFSWEITRYIQTTLPPGAVVMATFSRGHAKDSTSLPGTYDNNDSCDETMVATTYNHRPQSYIQMPGGDQLQNSSKGEIHSGNVKDSDSFDSDSCNEDDGKKKYNYTFA